ncbi:MAG: type I-U CRISPR-associated protein Csx17 [Nitrospirota bacterium]
MPDLRLEGCRPEPLAHYLKALGVLRLVSEQVDTEARGWWAEDVFWLRTKLTREELEKFFLVNYRPTPIVAPWNGGSGFYYQEEKLKEKDPVTGKRKKTGVRNQPTAATRIVDVVAKSTTDRLADYRQVIQRVRSILQSRNYQEAPGDEEKESLMRELRGQLPDMAVHWLDAVFLLTDQKPKYPPLLGTGGNDGNTDFSSNFMQRLLDLVEGATGMPSNHASAWLQGALLGIPVKGLKKGAAIGQFDPAASGGTNAGPGFEVDSLINPWDFVLMMEGALVFAAAATKRLCLSGPGELSYPFTTRATPVGYGSSSESGDNPRGEVWVPLWSAPTRFIEVTSLFSEGRAQIGRRQASNGVDFARAVASLGTDRGVQMFHRYGFLQRNGKNFYATGIGRWIVGPRPEVNLLNELDRWLMQFRRAATGNTAPARMGEALRNIERAIMEYCQAGGALRMANVLIALGEAEAASAKTPKFRQKHFLRPVPLLSPRWLDVANDESPEFRLAASLASVGIRENMEPIEVRAGYVTWLEAETHPRVVWGHGSLTNNLIAVLSRRCLDAQREEQKGLPLRGRYPAALSDVHEFIAGRVDEQRLEALLRGLSLVNWDYVQTQPSTSDTNEVPLPALYALLKLTHLPGALRDVVIPYIPAILGRAAMGQAGEASRLAIQLLRGCGFIPMVEVVVEPPTVTRRIAAAVLFPISKRDELRLAADILKPSEQGVPIESATKG